MENVKTNDSTSIFLLSFPFFMFIVKTYYISTTCQELGMGEQKTILQHMLKEFPNM